MLLSKTQVRDMIKRLNLFSLTILLSILVAFQGTLPCFAQEDASSPVDRPIKDKWALVIGINKFEDPTIPTLQYSAKDARDFANFLIKKGNFASDHVLVLLNEEATDDNILKAIADGWLPKRALPDDLIVIFVSTHGSPKEIDQIGKDNFLIAYNTHRDSLFSTGVRLKDLARIARSRTRCERIVLLLDACNSGAAEAGGKGLYRAGNFDIASLVGEGQIVISSSSASQRSWESKRYKNGVFTKVLMDALQTKGEETTLPDAFNILKDKVMQEVRFDRSADQTPLMKSKWSGRPLALLARPVQPRATLPYLKKSTTKVAMVPRSSGASKTSTTSTSSPSTNSDTSEYVPPVDEPTKFYKTALQFAKLKEFNQAFDWYKKAAALGHAGAQGQLGCMFASGVGTPQNGEEAVKWLEKAAAAGDTAAQARLGSLLLQGQFVSKDTAKALELLASAANKGNAQAEYLLGCMYLTGKGVTKDDIKAKEFLIKAARGGIARANNVLSSIGEKTIEVDNTE